MEEQTTQILGMDPSTLVGKGVTLAVAVAIAALAGHFLARAARKALDRSRVPSASIFVNVLRAFVWALALLSVMQPVFGIQPTAFVAALGITSLVISFGLQDTISNVIGGLGLMMGHVIEPGDAVSVAGATGVVTDITWRHTVVRTSAGDDVVIPNSVLNKTALTRLSDLSRRECSVAVTVVPGTDPDSVAEDIVRTISEALGDRSWGDVGTIVRFGDITPDGTRADVLMHVETEVGFGEARDLASRALATKPYVSNAVASR